MFALKNYFIAIVSQQFKAINVENDSGVSKLKSHLNRHHRHSSSSSSSGSLNQKLDVLLEINNIARAAAASLALADFATDLGNINCDLGMIGVCTDCPRTCTGCQ
jgi:hypothetical protein